VLESLTFAWGSSTRLRCELIAHQRKHAAQGAFQRLAHDGGIYRPVQLLISPKTFVSALTSKLFPIPQWRRKACRYGLFRNTDRNRGRGEPLFELSTMKPGRL